LSGKPDVIARLQQLIDELFKEKGLEKDEVLVMLYGSAQQWSVWLYPVTANLNIIERLMGTGMIRLKQLKETRAQDKKKKLIERYTC